MLVDPPDLAQMSSMRRRAADRVARVPADDQVEAGAVGSERVVARRADLGASLPPAVLAADNARVEARVELARARARRSASRSPPIAGADSAALAVSGCSSTSGSRARLRRLGKARCWLWQRALFGAGQDEWIAGGDVGCVAGSSSVPRIPAAARSRAPERSASRSRLA